MGKIYFIRLWHWKRRLSWPVGQWKSEGMLGRIIKVEKNSEEKRCKNRKKNNLTWALWLFGKGKNRLLFGRLWNAVITSRHKMEMKYSDKGTLVQQQRCPLSSRSLQYWPMNHCVRNTISRRSVFENVFDNCFVIIGNEEFNHTGIKCRGGQNDANPNFQESKTEEKKSKAERKSEKHYHFNNCTFNFKEPQ